MASSNKNPTVVFTDLEISDGSKKMQNNPSCFLSSASLDRNIIDCPLPPEQSTHLSVTAVLNYCKSKILNPYLRLLSIVGLRPLITNQEPCLCLQTLNYFYTIQLIVLLVVGYILQYMACFRRDRGICYKIPNDHYALHDEAKHVYEQICQAPLLYSFLIPNILHLLGYLHAVVVIRHSDDDQLPVLMERVFLTSTNLSNGIVYQRKLIRILWVFVSFTGIWMVLSLVVINFMMTNGIISFKWIENQLGPNYLITTLKVLVIVCTLWHDVVQAAIISNYCLQAQLLTTYLQFLREKLFQCPIQPLEWIRCIETFKKMLNFLNHAMAPSVCIFTFMNLVCATSGTLWLFNYDNVDRETMPIVGVSILNITLWTLITLAPFIQAARLSNQCDILRNAGQEVRTKPFVYQDTPGHELDSILLYTATLKLRAKLFYVPITGKYLCLLFVLTAVVILVLGQCHYLNMN